MKLLTTKNKLQLKICHSLTEICRRYSEAYVENKDYVFMSFCLKKYTYNEKIGDF